MKESSLEYSRGRLILDTHWSNAPDCLVCLLGGSNSNDTWKQGARMLYYFAIPLTYMFVSEERICLI